ncbi:SpoIIE family protein phosphatase [Streptomyces sp. NPDC059852]|uniref:SpoIIE family protein phosphatase n=1 Tax=Streptomyces sp. NPDC059852 TaxID=3346972 RepID=UPI00365CE284
MPGRRIAARGSGEAVPDVTDGGPDPEAALPDSLLVDLVRDTGASVGMTYVLAPGDPLLRLALVSGVSHRIAAPWARIPMDTAIPVVDAIRDRRLIWLGSQEETARRYPRLGIVLPYDFMLAAAPITDGGPVRGGVVLLWPVWHPPQLSAAEREAITSGCARAADFLDRAADSGHLLDIPDEPHLVAAPHAHDTDPRHAMAALAFADRLPLGCCALDLDGRLTYINAAGADLVGAGAAALLGKRPWEVLFWLHDPLFEDRYRAAVVTRRPTTFTATRPPDTRLVFRLYPDETGISVHIAPADEAATGPRATTVVPPPAEPFGAAALYHLTHVAAALAEAAGAKDVVELAADQIVPAFGPRALALLTLREGRLRLAGHRGYDRELMSRFDTESLTSDAPAVRAVNTGTAAFFPSFADLQRAYPPARHLDGMASWAFLPLIVSGRPVGSLVLAYEAHRAFPPAERALLTSLAGLIAQALDRARLYDAKHSLAHTLQNALLPRSLGNVPGLDAAARYRPASHGMDIGGDFYDLIRRTPTSAIAAIGDVQGHNTTAAALMGQVRTAVHAHATSGASPGDILARTNRLLADLNPGLFVSCLIVHLDLARHSAQLATAGHPPALLRHPDGRAGPVPAPAGLLLGITPDADYATVDVPLPPGALLVLYTDGLVERPGVDIDDAIAAVTDRLAASPPDDLDALADALLEHAGQAASNPDDIALLLVRPHR